MGEEPGARAFGADKMRLQIAVAGVSDIKPQLQIGKQSGGLVYIELERRSLIVTDGLRPG